MKKISFLLLCVALVQIAIAQIKMQSDGNIVAYKGTMVPTGTAKFSILGSNSATGISSLIYSNYGVSGSYIGISGVVSEAPNGSSMSIGVLGKTNYCATGKNYGVYGGISLVNGAGILGATVNSSYPALTDKYAGYFSGNVNVTNLLTANSMAVSSDFRYETNIQPITAKHIQQLNPVMYNYRQRFMPAVDTLGNNIEIPVFEENSQIFQKTHYGLIAQEVKELYPDLVYEDGDGYLSVDYVGIIPLLIASVNELKSEIEDLKNVNIRQQNTFTQISVAENNSSSVLYQNVPNPFFRNTEIKYYLPQTVNKAYLCIYNLQGTQLKQTVLLQRGEGSQILSGSEFPAGIYLYSLITDGQEIDTKRMILTE
jgi:hypothetical protein